MGLPHGQGPWSVLLLNEDPVVDQLFLDMPTVRIEPALREGLLKLEVHLVDAVAATGTAATMARIGTDSSSDMSLSSSTTRVARSSSDKFVPGK